jgi:hypothetical protein
MLIETG